ncbi:50S ribosomal protein L3 N(5)-glutamine methyltransferase [Methylocella sp. CPCC 101449]|uniref:50S ribosomal protein L3 N(5)-glutamine methyltransferase n=1 Tax=Methylocella sp. CPCC 101449 TaxID=2987531 RepID=UPI00288EEAFB|nr:50S ribosomal protein L3 N(5)-glutamine methyltransferase [Methylocella sp. CPCC 101449]MDT2024067.1 50S ribosomal protein L3 N(5)-glutamine methyltransferase [Methylocella sp. CPCC 101449]
MTADNDPADGLLTLRDFLRFAITRFEAAKLAYGHGTANALDEAAFILLEALHLPIDNLDPFLDARLLPQERRRLVDLIETRISTRKPASYLLNKAYIRGVPFYVDERVIVPRSFIGDLLFSGLFGGGEGALVSDPDDIGSVLDLCTGSGCLAILAAQAFPNAQIDAVDLSPDAIEVARRNVKEANLEARIELFQGDLFAPLGKRRYDLILTNPPYVDAHAMAALPPEYEYEPKMALAGGPDGLDIVRHILRETPKRLHDGGGLLCEIGTGREILDAEFPELPLMWLDTENSDGEVFWIAAADFSC